LTTCVEYDKETPLLYCSSWPSTRYKRILDLATPTQQGVLSSLPLAVANLRTSLYADDVAMFVTPGCDQLQSVNQILQVFGSATVLVINFEKSSVHPINCANVDLMTNILQLFTGSCKMFPCRYHDLTLHTRPLQKNHIQPLVEKIGQRLTGCKGQLLNWMGRLTLVTPVLSSMSTYHMSIFPLAKWDRKQIDKICRFFLWKGEDNANGGHCLVN
jgi:hypothetical protein